MKPLLVGELNPYGIDPKFALYPVPKYASGARLAEILNLSRGRYLDRFDRVNLCIGEWSMKEARLTAEKILNQERDVVILLGRKVATAFDVHVDLLTACLVGDGATAYVIPHPSGLNRFWNEPDARERVRALLAPVLKEVLA